MTDPPARPDETVACLGSSTTASRGTYKWIDELEKRPQNRRFRFVNLGVGGDLSFHTVRLLDRVIKLRGRSAILGLLRVRLRGHRCSVPAMTLDQYCILVTAMAVLEGSVTVERSRIDRVDRADRILDTARDLLLRWGYRRVTIDELARRAGVGKGTIYLHWRSREELFYAVSTREAAAMTDAIVGGLEHDPAEVALHRYLRRLFVEAMNRPVLRALYTRDGDILDTFLAMANHRRLEETKLGVNRDYLGVLAAQGMLRPELRPEDLDYALPTIVFGFFAAEPFLPPSMGLSLDQKADQLAGTVRRAFEPADTPDSDRMKRAAAKAIPIFERLARDYRTTTYGGDHDD